MYLHFLLFFDKIKAKGDVMMKQLEIKYMSVNDIKPLGNHKIQGNQLNCVVQ